MDWQYKHFSSSATFNAPRESVLEAAHAVVAASLGELEMMPGGFVARGSSAWHGAIATFHVTPVPNGTLVAVELKVERAGLQGFMLVDIGGYYTGQIDKWFVGIAERLGGPQTLLSKTALNYRVQQGCLLGCLVYLIAGACFALLAIPLNQVLIPGASGSFFGPFTFAALGIGLLLGLGAYLAVAYPDAPLSQFIRAHARIRS